MIARTVAFLVFIAMLGSPVLVAETALPSTENADANATLAALPAGTKSALKLAGLVTFVANSCPALQPDYGRFKAALAAFGVSTEDLKKSDLKAIYLGYTTLYAADTKVSCERARLAFGAKGSTIPDLFANR